METTTQRKFKWFWAWQDDKEEAWLGEMARHGWHLVRPEVPGFYTFQAGAPGDYAYRLDYQSDPKLDKQEYVGLFSDAGWEHLGTMGGWHYFRKAVRPGETAEIYTDSESKIAKYRRLMFYLVTLLPVLIMFLIIVPDREMNIFMGILTLIYAGFMGLYAAAMIMLLRRINQLKNL